MKRAAWGAELTVASGTVGAHTHAENTGMHAGRAENRWNFSWSQSPCRSIGTMGWKLIAIALRPFFSLSIKAFETQANYRNRSPHVTLFCFVFIFFLDEHLINPLARLSHVLQEHITRSNARVYFNQPWIIHRHLTLRTPPQILKQIIDLRFDQLIELHSLEQDWQAGEQTWYHFLPFGTQSVWR